MGCARISLLRAASRALSGRSRTRTGDLLGARSTASSVLRERPPCRRGRRPCSQVAGEAVMDAARPRPEATPLAEPPGNELRVLSRRFRASPRVEWQFTSSPPILAATQRVLRWTHAHCSRNGRLRFSRLATLRRAFGPGSPRDLCRQSRYWVARERGAYIRDERFLFLEHDLTQPLFLDEHVDVVYHLASPASPIDYQRFPCTRSRWAPTARITCSASRSSSVRASCSPRRAQVHPQPETYWGM